MARTEAKVTVNNFIGGLVTDYHELNTPQNVTVDEDNCDLDRKGSRKRRLGIDYEDSYQFSSNVVNEDDLSGTYLKTYKWKAINNNANLNFLIVQLGSTLEFYDLNFDALSANRKSFEIDLEDYKIPGATTTSNTGIQVDSGKGVLFIVGKYIEPLRVEYDEDADDITVTETPISVRDLTQMLNDPDNIGFKTSEADFSLELYYDLYNQGWGSLIKGNDSNNPGATVTQGVTALGFYRSSIGSYPPKSKPWWVGKRSAVDAGEAGFEIFDPSGVYEMVEAGSTLAPLGHFIINPFNIDRNSVLAAQQAANPLSSGYYLSTTFEVETDFTRPTAVAYHAGRLFYGHNNTVYFSQLLYDDLDNAGKCYQAADPTAEDINELVDSDGGTILIPTSGEIIAFVSLENILLVFSDNGLWSIGGAAPGEGFTATGFTVSKLSSIGAASNRSIVTAEGTPYFWADEGIFTVQSDQAKIGFKVINICEKKIQEFYDDIPDTSIRYASGAYDKVKKVITWIFNSTSSTLHGNVYACNRDLNYDLLVQAFYPYTRSDLSSNSPFVVDVFSIKSVLQQTNEVNVVNSSGTEVVNSSSVQVVADEVSLGSTTLDVGLKFLTLTPVEVVS